MTTKPKQDGDNLYWVVERECAVMQARVAESHGKRGNTTVLMTGRAIPEERIDALAKAGVRIVNTK